MLLIVEYAGRFAPGAWKPIETLETPPGVTGNYLFTALGVVMLVLSTWKYQAAARP